MIDSSAWNLTECPSPEVLCALADGLVTSEAFESLSAHVEGCATCKTRLDTVPTGPLERDLRRALQSGHTDLDTDSPEVARIITAVAPAFTIIHEDERTRQTVLETPAVEDRTLQTMLETPSGVEKSFGQYRLLEELGRGGMGVVYRAEHVFMNRPVAIKFISEQRLSDPHYFDRFRREVRLIAALDHPHIVRAYDAGENDSQQYLVMELVHGTDTRTILRSEGPFRVADACEIARQVALGLQYLADNGMVHRDIKPSNLLLTLDGIVKIADLGLARLHVADSGADEVTATNVGLGSLDYTAPEQASDARSADIRSDLYSLGCTLFALLTGRPPFGDSSHTSPQAKLLAHATETPPSARVLRPDVPEGVDAILSRLMQKDQGSRIESPDELANALAPFTNGASLSRLSGTLAWSAGRMDPTMRLTAGGTTAEPTSVDTPRKTDGPRPRTGGWNRARKLALGMGVAGIAGVVALGGYLSRIDDHPQRDNLIETVTLQEVVPTNPDIGSWEVIDEGRAVRIVSERQFLLAVSAFDGGNIEFAATLRQPDLDGRIGLFFETVGQQDAFGAVEFATVEIQHPPRSDPNIALKLRTVDGNPLHEPASTLQSSSTGLRGAKEVDVMVRVVNGSLAMITVNGVPCPELPESWTAHAPDGVTMKGRFGFWCDASSGTAASLKIGGRDVRLIRE